MAKKFEKINEEAKLDGKKQVVYATFYSLGSKFLTYLLLLVFANLYTPEEYGLGSFAYNLRNIIMLFVFIGLPEALIPLLVKRKKVESVIKAIIWITISVTLICLILSLLPGALQLWILPLVITFPIVMVTNIGTAILRAREQYSQTYTAGFYSMIVTLISAYLLRGFGSWAVVGAYSLGNLCAFLIVAKPVKKELITLFSKSIRFRGKIGKDLKEYIFFALGIALVGSSLTLMYWITSTALGLYGYFADIAKFGVASALASILTIIPISISMIILTKASKLKKLGNDVLLARSTRISFFITLIGAILLTTFMPWILKLFFPKYLGIEIYTAILIFGSVCFASSYVIYSYHIGIMNLRNVLSPILIGLVVHLIISLIFATKFGLGGILITQSTIQLAILVYLAKSQNIKRITLAAIASLLLFWAAYSSIMLGLLAIIATIPLAIITKIIDRQDISIIKKTFCEILIRTKY